jgi:hypothetical protein
VETERLAERNQLARDLSGQPRPLPLEINLGKLERSHGRVGG